MLPADFQISSFLPPGITTIGGKTYACPGWHVIPEGTTLEEVYSRWTKLHPKEEAKPENHISEEVKSSKGDKTYTVTFDGKYWSCECVGFQYNRKCKHVTEIKTKHGI